MTSASTSVDDSSAVPGINRGWLLALGLLMIALGVIGLGMTYRLTSIAIFWVGVLAIIAGLGQLLDAYHHKAWRGVIWHVIVGAVYLLIGLVLTTMPVTSAFWLTMAIAAGLALAGLMRLLIVFQLRGHAALQVVVLVSALLAFGLAFYIFQTLTLPDADTLATAEGRAAWTRSWGWVIGLIVAVELVAEGVSLISIAITGKALRRRIA